MAFQKYYKKLVFNVVDIAAKIPRPKGTRESPEDKY